MIIPEEVFKRRRQHNNTPESTLLIIANFMVVAIATSLFASKDHINWFFWVIIGLLAVYNLFTIRKNREEFFTKAVVIAYAISVATLVGVFFLYTSRS